MRVRDEQKEQTIRDKAIEMIVTEGLDGFSMQKLAKAANVSPATLYLYYENKEDMIARLYAWVSDDALVFMLKDFNPDMHFAEGFRIQWKNRAKYSIENPVYIAFLDQLRHSPFHEKAEALQMGTFKEMMGKFISGAIRNKELIELPFEVYWAVAFAPLYQLIKFHMDGKSFVNRKFVLTNNKLEQTLELVLKALKP